VPVSGSGNAVRKPLVSVIIPTHNRADMLCRAVDSVLKQTLTDFELIIVDDGSTDDTCRRIEAHTDPRIRYIRHQLGKGASAARNTGIRHAHGNYIAFLDDDDEWLPTKLEKQVAMLEQAPEQVRLVYCWMDYYENGRLVRRHHPTLRGYVFDQVLDEQRLGGCPTLLVRREVVEDIGGFDESLPRGNDGDFIRRICREYEVDFVPEVLVKVYTGHGREQITRYDEQGVRNAIKGQTAKLIKFRDELHKYPKQTAAIYSIIAHHYSQLGDWRNCMAFYLRALRTCPFSAKLYVRLLRDLRARIMNPKRV